jgi:DNA-binding MarR family transcriptional regulator
VDRVLEAWNRERPDLDFSPWAVTRRIEWLSHRLHYSEQFYEPFGLNRGSVEVLTMLRQSSPDHQLSPTALCRGTMVTSATMTNRLDRLEQDGLVRRLPDPTDRRALLVQITPHGTELIDEVLSWVMVVRHRQIEALTPDEQTTLANLQRKLVVSLDTNGKPIPEEQATASIPVVTN